MAFVVVSVVWVEGRRERYPCSERVDPDDDSTTRLLVWWCVFG